MNKELQRRIAEITIKNQLPKYNRVLYRYQQKGYSKKICSTVEPISFLEKRYGKDNIVEIQYIRLPEFKGVAHVWYRHGSTTYYDLWQVIEEYLP